MFHETMLRVDDSSIKSPSSVTHDYATYCAARKSWAGASIALERLLHFQLSISAGLRLLFDSSLRTTVQMCEHFALKFLTALMSSPSVGPRKSSCHPARADTRAEAQLRYYQHHAAHPTRCSHEIRSTIYLLMRTH